MAPGKRADGTRKAAETGPNSTLRGGGGRYLGNTDSTIRGGHTYTVIVRYPWGRHQDAMSNEVLADLISHSVLVPCARAPRLYTLRLKTKD